MSVKVHEAFSIDSFQDHLLWWDDFLGDQIQDEWLVTVAAGSIAVVDAQTGGIARLTTAGAANDTSILDWGNFRTLHIDKKVTAEFRVKLSSVSDIWAYLALRFDVSTLVRFTFNSGTDTNWELEAKNAGTTTVDSGIPPDTDYHIFRIECFPTDEVHFYIDGVECGNSPITVAANIPDDAGDFLKPYLFIRTLADAAKTMDVDYCVVRQEI